MPGICCLESRHGASRGRSLQVHDLSEIWCQWSCSLRGRLWTILLVKPGGGGGCPRTANAATAGSIAQTSDARSSPPDMLEVGTLVQRADILGINPAMLQGTLRMETLLAWGTTFFAIAAIGLSIEGKWRSAGASTLTSMARSTSPYTGTDRRMGASTCNRYRQRRPPARPAPQSATRTRILVPSGNCDVCARMVAPPPRLSCRLTNLTFELNPPSRVIAGGYSSRS